MCVCGRRRTDKAGERDTGACFADAAVAVGEEDWGGRFDCAILSI